MTRQYALKKTLYADSDFGISVFGCVGSYWSKSSGFSILQHDVLLDSQRVNMGDNDLEKSILRSEFITT